MTLEITKRILEEARKDMEAAKEVENSKPADIEPVKREFGVTDKVEENLRETPIFEDANKIESPSTTPKVPNQKPKESPDMDFYRNRQN